MAEYNAVFCGADLRNIYPICEKVIELVFKAKKCETFTAVITGDQTAEFADRLTARFADRVKVVPVAVPPGAQTTEASAAREVVLQNVGYLDLVLVQPAAFGCVSLDPGDQYFSNCVHHFLNVTENLLSLLKPNGRFVNLTLPYIVPQFQKCSRKIQKMLLSSKLTRELLYSLAHRYAEAIRSKTYEVDEWSSDYVVMAHVFCYAAILMINRDRNLEFDRLSPNCNSGCLIYSVAPSRLPHLASGLDDSHNKEIADALAGEFTKPEKICGSVLIGQHAVPLNCKLEDLGNLLGGVESIVWEFSLTDHLINPLIIHASSEFSTLPGQSQCGPYSVCSASNSSMKREPARCACQNCTCDLVADCGSGAVCKCLSCPCRTCQCQACNCTALIECKNECRCPACECRTCDCSTCNCGRYNLCAVNCKCKVCSCKICECATCNCCVKVDGACASTCNCNRCKCMNAISAPPSIDSRDPTDTGRFLQTKPEQVICCADSHKCTCKNCCFNQPDGSTRSLKEGCICTAGATVTQTTDEKMQNIYVRPNVIDQTMPVTETVLQQSVTVGTTGSQHSSQAAAQATYTSVSQYRTQVVSGNMGEFVDTAQIDTTTAPVVPSGHASTSQSAMSQHTASHHTASQHTASQNAASQHTVSQNAASQHTVSQNAPSQHTVSQNAPSQHTVSQNAQSQHSASQHTGSQVAASQHTASQLAASQNTISQNTMSQTSNNQMTQQMTREESIRQIMTQPLGAQLSTGPVNIPTAVYPGQAQQIFTAQGTNQLTGNAAAYGSTFATTTTTTGAMIQGGASLGITQLTGQVSPANSGSQTDVNLLNKALSPLAPGAMPSLIPQTGVLAGQAPLGGYTRSYSGSPLNSREIGGFTTLQTSSQPSYHGQAQTTTTTTTTVINQGPTTTTTNVQTVPTTYQQSTGNVQQTSSHHTSSQHSSMVNAQAMNTMPSYTSTSQIGGVMQAGVQPMAVAQTSTGVPVTSTQATSSYVQTNMVGTSTIAPTTGMYRTSESQVSQVSQVAGGYKETSRIYTDTTSTINQAYEVNQPPAVASQPPFQPSFATTTTTQMNRPMMGENMAGNLRTISNAQCLTICNKGQTSCSLNDFTTTVVPRVAELAENELSVKLEYLATNYWLVARAQDGDQVRSRGLARVLQSRNPNWAAGDLLCDDFPWVQGEFCHTPTECARKYNPSYAPDVYLSAYSDDAISAQMLLKACSAEFGKTLIVNECVSPIAYLTCLFAKRVLNMAVIAVASSPQACQVLKEQIGVNICINSMNCVAGQDMSSLEGQKVAYTKYLNELRAALAQLGTSHVDCVIENHGGYQLDAHLALLNEQTHIAFCGLASSGNGQVSSDPHEQYAYKNLNSLFKTSSSIRGYKSSCTDTLRDAACSQHVAEVVKTFYDQTDRMMVQPDLRIPQVPCVNCTGVLSDALKVLVHVVNSPTPAKSCVLKIAE